MLQHGAAQHSAACEQRTTRQAAATSYTGKAACVGPRPACIGSMTAAQRTSL